ncbi:hypothetical protein DL93DRAFT_2096860 [Clavulina sp. PMI_390]|nr:hypothetical protein DL93DRAFT_2096860 [Clavulina sp. PMI_390]
MSSPSTLGAFLVVLNWRHLCTRFKLNIDKLDPQSIFVCQPFSTMDPIKIERFAFATAAHASLRRYILIWWLTLKIKHAKRRKHKVRAIKRKVRQIDKSESKEAIVQFIEHAMDENGWDVGNIVVMKEKEQEEKKRIHFGTRESKK